MKIDIIQLENLSKDKNYKSKNKEVVFEASGEGGFYIYEKKKNKDINISVSKKNSKIFQVTKTVKYSKENITELFSYLSNGNLQQYIKSKDSEIIQKLGMKPVSVNRYVMIIERFNESRNIVFQKNYNSLFKIKLNDILAIVEKNEYKDVSISKIYLDDELTNVPILGLTKNDFNLNTPYWVIRYSKIEGSNEFFLRIYDGISGRFILEKSSSVIFIS
ncbi:hypothetical protein [Chryseobacterium sp. JUb7]|uniref:hypothetical protein n=1 Tax=Chryseobacterium sp. JUb7 TaxID=2940599 RepID=UPI0021674BE4|nr:hypothetical protein [Chryseobacterium sp. JUb7]MCS3533045.1 hypothetical protein [Chryseobacterium sp. JUb7]